MGLSGCLALSPWIPNLEENRGRKNVCVVVRAAAAAEQCPDPGHAARNWDSVPAPFWASTVAEPLGSKDPEPSSWILCSGTGGAVVQGTLTLHTEPQTRPNPT